MSMHEDYIGMSAFDLEMKGMPELLRKLHKLDTRSGRKVLRKSTRAASAPIQKAIRRATPVGKTSNLKKSIGRKFKFYRRSTTDIAVIGPMVNEASGKKGFHGHLVEFGTVARVIKDLWGRFKRGLVGAPVSGSAGVMPANPFAKRAASGALLSAAGQKGVDALKKALEQEMKAVGRGG